MKICTGISKIDSLPVAYPVLPSGEIPLTSAEPAAVSDAAAVESAPPATAVQDPFWRRVSELLAAVWVITLIAWWWSSRPKRGPREPEPVPVHRQQAKHLKAARKAALAGDGKGVRQAMLEVEYRRKTDELEEAVGGRAAAPGD